MSNPQHIAIIPDGDRRWAKNHCVHMVKGYLAGIHALENTVKHALHLGVPFLSFWVLSHDNAKRSPEWQKMFLELVSQHLKPKCQSMFDQNIGVKIIGDWPQMFTGQLAQDIQWVCQNSPSSPAMTVVFFLCYSGSRDIQQAVQCVIDKSDHPENYKNYLQTRVAGIPDPELCIRTSGEQRLSDYMLIQCAHTELYFLSKFWPDFTTQDLDQALLWYQNVERRFGV